MSDEDNSATTTDRCNYCLKRVGKASLKQCSKCRYVRYCSRECQHAAWPTHKKACGRAGAPDDDDAGDTDLARTLNKWLACWRGTLFEFGILAMDLANAPRDKLATHVVFIELEQREPLPAERARYFMVRGGRVMTRAEFADALRFFDTTEDQVAAWEADARGADTLQLDLVADGLHHRTLYLSYRVLEHYFAADKRVSATFGRTWLDALTKKVERGQPGFDNASRWPEPREEDLEKMKDLDVSS